MYKNIYILSLLLMSGAYAVHAAEEKNDSDSDIKVSKCATLWPNNTFVDDFDPNSYYQLEPGMPSWQQEFEIPEKNYFSSHQQLLLAILYEDADELKLLLDQECARVESIFPEVKTHIHKLVRNADEKESAAITSSLPTYMPQPLITIIMEYKGPGDILDGYQLQELIIKKKSLRKKGMFAGLSRQIGRLRSLLFERSHAHDETRIVTVESTQPRSSLALTAHSGETLLEYAKDQEEMGIGDINACIALLEQQPVELMKAYLQLCRGE